ncbi:hypothetical protein Cpin_5428 [Chitinophaga pinensis DSM 2588]|uniref:Uncharacterized protein n=1 Tax=Chitinophaga pinensis (strain ATCC 43595 / DSM 2588 / LMG 13176 / NBRC 15968 / NCIMB 11800 / UQM 2034) TaxID=485918 RepID=A0A979GS73_CHIPD|nr:hypothetical protein Cpin_5428 [Chitinophaga pinensis DSM 2588]
MVFQSVTGVTDRGILNDNFVTISCFGDLFFVNYGYADCKIRRQVYTLALTGMQDGEKVRESPTG